MFNGSYDLDNENAERTDTIVAYLVKVEGDMVSQGNIRIDGEFKGTLDVGGKLTIGQDAKVEAQIKAKNVFVAGQVKGNLEVQEQLELSSTAKIDGDIKTQILIVEAGAVLNGNCNMSGLDLKEQPTQKQEQEVDEESVND